MQILRQLFCVSALLLDDALLKCVVNEVVDFPPVLMRVHVLLNITFFMLQASDLALVSLSV